MMLIGNGFPYPGKGYLVQGSLNTTEVPDAGPGRGTGVRSSPSLG